MFRPLEPLPRRPSMTTYTKTINLSTLKCQYHVVFTPKYRKKVLYGMIRRDLKDVLHRLAKQKECVIKPTVSLIVTYVVVCSYGYDDGRISPTHCALIDGRLGGR